VNLLKKAIFVFAIYYAMVYMAFFAFDIQPDFPTLKTRLGTILYGNYSNPLMPMQIYCYYPGEKSGFKSRGESIIKPAEHISECIDWYGILEIKKIDQIT